MAAPNEITPPQLLRLIGTPDCPAIVDISIDPDFDADPFLIPGAFRHPHTDVDGLLARLDRQACVVVCQQGFKLSQGMAALLRTKGIRAEYLQGGNFGWRALDAAPRLPFDAIPAPVQGVAERYGAVPFDVEDTFWSHRGAMCTFDTMLDTFTLRTPALDRLARVVRAADTNDHADVPEAAGLLAISVGLSRQYRDDLAQLEAGMVLYDALYRWARDGQGETHDWPEGKP